MQKKLKDVAKELGVSPSTVSKVINSKPGVGDELREQISDYLEKIDFYPNAIAQSMITGRLKIIGLIFGDIRNPYYAELVYNIQKAMNKYGYITVAFNSDYDTEKEIFFINQAIQMRFTGLFLITADNVQLLETVKKAKASGVSVVLINRMLPGYDGSFVSTDNFMAGYLAAKHLVDLGHRSIAFLSGAQSSSASQLRYKGFRQLLDNYGIAFDEEKDYFVGDLTDVAGKNAAEEYYVRFGKQPHAIVIANDMMALAFLDTCRRKGIRIPEDLSAVSFDNIPYASYYGIELTTIDQHVNLISEKATKIMLEQKDNPDIVVREMIEPTLIIRATTTPCNIKLES